MLLGNDQLGQMDEGIKIVTFENQKDPILQLEIEEVVPVLSANIRIVLKLAPSSPWHNRSLDSPWHLAEQLP